MADMKVLRAALNWSQVEMAELIGCDQATVWRVESRGQAPTGPVRRILHRLSHLVAEGRVLPDMPMDDVVSLFTFDRLPPAVVVSPPTLQTESA